MRLREILLTSSLAVVFAHTAAAEPLKVVASFSILGDFVRNVGGEHVSVATLVGPNGDAHVFAPSPADARKTAAADLVVVNGLGFEGWLDRLVEASGFSGPVLEASEGVEALLLKPEQQGHQVETAGDGGESGKVRAEGEHAHGEEEPGDHHPVAADPHAWQSAANALIYVSNISAALCDADPPNCAAYQANATAYGGEIGDLDAAIKAGFAAIPAERRVVITSHDAFAYFGHAYGIDFLAPQGVSTDSEASAADVAALIEQIRQMGITTLFAENISDPRLIEQIARETGARPGGALYSDALSGSDGPAPTYLSMMRNNFDLLLAAMLGS